MKEQRDNITFHFLKPVPLLKNRKKLKEFIHLLIIKEQHKITAINYVFCSDNDLLEFNRKYLNHNTLTDIITFQLNASTEPILSDIYISVDRVKENALKFEISMTHELHRVILHGALHLCGFKDKTKQEKSIMTDKEDYYLKNYFVPRETI